MLGGAPIELPAGDDAPPVRAGGTLAGSALRMDVAVANMVRAGAGLPQAVAAATRVPADLIGRPDLGRIIPGAQADLTWLGESLRTQATWVAGEPVYHHERTERRTEERTERRTEERTEERTAERTERRTAERTERRTAERCHVNPTSSVTRMRAEIEEQPQALRATLDALLPRAGEITALTRQTRQVLFIARGTSDNAAVYGSYLVQVRAGRLATLASPSVATVYRTRLDLSGVLAVGLSQSGRTEEIVATLAWAAACGARTLAITNGAGSPLAEAADLALVTEAGAERAVPATKTFTTQLAALAVLGIGLAGDAEGAPGTGGGSAPGAEPLDAGELRAVPDEIERLLAARSDLEPIIGGLAGVEGAVVSGRGFAYSAALELALKLKEACYLHAMGLSFADLLHGPIAVVGRRTPAIIMAADAGPTLDGAVALAGRVRRAGATAYGIGGGAALAAECAYALPGPRLPEWLAPIGLITGGQLLTEALARRLGINPDSPRGLSKVTQTS